MKMQYVKTAVLNSKLFFTAHGQYSFIVTPENCPGLAFSGRDQLTDTSYSHCDNDDLETIRQIGDETLLVTCANIGGTYELTLHNGETELDGGFNCPDGEIFVIAPTDVSPALTADCIVNSISAPPESGITCSIDG